jgi:hypothetical protein
MPADPKLCREVHPFVSSRTPSNKIIQLLGNSHRTHLFMNVMITLNIMTHPQTLIIAAVAFFIASGNDIDWSFGLVFDSPLVLGIKRPTSNADKIWIPHRNHTSSGSLNSTLHIPKIKEGPALLQNPKNLWASALVICPLLQASYIHFAPTGYPPNKPTRRRLSVPGVILQKRENGLKIANCVPPKAPVSTEVITIKGNNDGITV